MNNMNSKQLLDHLEHCPKTWAVYIRHQVKSVQDHVLALRQFADLKPGSVADACNERADTLEARVERLLASLPSSHEEVQHGSQPRCRCNDTSPDPRTGAIAPAPRSSSVAHPS